MSELISIATLRSVVPALQWLGDYQGKSLTSDVAGARILSGMHANLAKRQIPLRVVEAVREVEF